MLHVSITSAAEILDADAEMKDSIGVSESEDQMNKGGYFPPWGILPPHIKKYVVS